jgi:hypothetical protein
LEKLPVSTAYTDFHLTIIRNQDHYSARVTTSPVGQASIDFTLPLSQAEIERFSWRTGFSPRDIILRKSPGSSTAPLSLEQFGTRLFDAVFAGKVGQLFFRSLDAAERANLNLRVQLQFDDVPEIAALPWEYLYVRDLNRFLVLSTRTPLVRYVALAQPERPLSVPLPLRVLAVLSNPSDVPRLQVEEEWTRLNQAVGDLVQRGLIVLDRLEGGTLAGLRQTLRRQPVNILHFIGHGDFSSANDGPEPEGSETGSLIFEDAAGLHDRVSARQIATLLCDHAPLRLVFLNACHSASGGSENFFAGVAQTLVQQGVPAVLAMQFAVSDRTAIALSHEFYQSISAGLPLESATSEARKAIYSEGDSSQNEFEWGTPVLFSRSPDGVILALPETGDEMNNSQANLQGNAHTQTRAWWQQLGEAGAALAGLDAPDAIGAAGDVIIGVVGAGASNVAVGKNISQQIYEVVGPPTPDDKQIVAQRFAALEAALSAQPSALDAAKLQMAQGYLTLLRGELSKTDANETPSASTITLVGNWLLDNVPQLLEALTSLFATPAVGRVIGKAGEAAVTWVKQRFA